MVTKRISLGDAEETILLCGEHDSNLKSLEKRFGVQIFPRASTLAVRGNIRKVDQAIASLEDMKSRIHVQKLNGRSAPVSPEPDSMSESFPDKSSTVGSVHMNGTGMEESLFTSVSGRKVRPYSVHQKKYVETILSSDMVMAVGPAGTGKTFLAVVCALKELAAGRVQKIVLSRPVVEAGEKLGFLPGDFYEKVNPYLKPLYDAFYALIGPERFRMYREEETIEIVPLAYMRGRTLDNAFAILDEAQNTTNEQMKMFLTRLGQHSKMVITGDVTQIDLEFKKQSGFVQVLKVLKDVPGINSVHFTHTDVVRHALVRDILKAYDDFDKKENPS